jgi:nucleotide-binding universal stress UspA family protein
MWKASAPVVVGVDGSDAAIDAAKWAIDEAISRDVPLRIVQVTTSRESRPHQRTRSTSTSNMPNRRCAPRPPPWRRMGNASRSKPKSCGARRTPL